MSLGRPSITTPSSLELRGVQGAIGNIRQRMEAVEAEVIRVAGVAGQTAFTGGVGGSTSSTIAIANLQTAVAALASRTGVLETSAATLLASDSVQDGQIAVLQYAVAAAQYDISVLAGLISALDLRPQCLDLFVGDETTAITTGTAKLTRRAPFAFTITDVRASLATAQTSGALFTVNVKANGTTIFSTKITIDNTERTSTTAAALPVLSTTALASDDELTVDVDQVGDGTAKGLKVYLIGTT